MNQVPSIWNMRRSLRGVNQAMRSNLGQPSHPRVSIAGGAFRLSDASGEIWPAHVIPHPAKSGVWAFVCIIIGANANKSKVFYPDGWDEHNPIPPLCFSDNGTAPSSNAQEPQARFCAECEFGKWNSKQSPITGRGIKACTDKKKIAVLPMGDPTGLAYELQIPPASLGALGVYSDFIHSVPFPTGERITDVSDVVTMISFEQGKTGYLNFDWAGWIDSVAKADDGSLVFCFNEQGPEVAPDGGMHVVQLIETIWDSGMVDTLVGNRDTPFQPPAEWRGAGMVTAGSQASIAPPQPHRAAPPSPYAVPAGVAVERTPPPPLPAGAPQQGGQGQLPAAQARGPRGGARPGAGRPPTRTRPATVMPAPSAALHQQPQPGNVVQHPAAAPAASRQPEVFPPFLNRSNPGWANTPPAGSAQPAQPAQPAGGSFGAAGSPPEALKNALDTAMNLRTEG